MLNMREFLLPEKNTHTHKKKHNFCKTLLHLEFKTRVKFLKD